MTKKKTHTHNEVGEKIEYKLYNYYCIRFKNGIIHT